MTVVGVTLAELVQATGRSRRVLRAVLADEQAAGRVVRDSDGRYRLAPTVDAATVAALAALANWRSTSGMPRVHVPPRDIGSAARTARSGRQGPQDATTAPDATRNMPAAHDVYGAFDAGPPAA